MSGLLCKLLIVDRDGSTKVEDVYPASFLSDVCGDARLRKCNKDRKSISVELLLIRCKFISKLHRN